MLLILWMKMIYQYNLKINIYRQFAQLLLGSAENKFTAPVSNPASNGTDDINAALFLNFKRLFVRDGIKRETFAMRFYQSASAAQKGANNPGLSDCGQSNVFRSTNSGSII